MYISGTTTKAANLLWAGFDNLGQQMIKFCNGVSVINNVICEGKSLVEYKLMLFKR